MIYMLLVPANDNHPVPLESYLMWILEALSEPTENTFVGHVKDNGPATP